ncbi:MAG: hypothetical protein HUJ31_14945, partial [Pseudomonadales bacterium]|nr:hypothetical protein [Pseudomonadales bacterium]
MTKANITGVSGDLVASFVGTGGANVTATTDAAGNIKLDSTGEMLTLNSVVSNNGLIEVSSAGGISAVNVTSTADAEANDISLTTTSGDITVANISAGAVGDVFLNSAAAVSDDGSAATLLTGDALTVNANGSITLDTDVASADISANASGAIDIDESDSIVLTDVDTLNGSITIDAGGQITATDVASLTDLDTNDVNLTTTAGDILVATISAGNVGDVALNSAGAIVDDGNSTTVIGADLLTADAKGAITVDTTIARADLSASLAGDIDVDETNAIALEGLDTVAGSITVNAGGSIDVDQAINVAGNLGLTAIGDISLNADVRSDLVASGDVTMVASGAISQATGTLLAVSGLLDVAGDDVTLINADAAGGVNAVTVDDFVIINNLDLALSGSIGGDLTATANGIISLRSGQSLSITGNSSFVADALSLTNLTATGNISLDIDDDALIVNTTSVVVEGSVLGDLTVTAQTGDITDSGELSVGGIGTFEALAGNITLNSVGNTFGFLDLFGGAVIVNESDATQLIDVSADSLSLSSAGNITQEAGSVLSVTGLASLSAGVGLANITLLENNNSFGSLSLHGADVLLLEQGDTQLDAVDADSLELTSTGSVTDGSGVDIVVSGEAFITASGDVLLGDEAADNVRFGTVNVSAANFSLDEADATRFGEIDLTGNLTLTSGGVIDQEANSIMTIGGVVDLNADNGAGTIVLDENNNSFGSITLAAGDVTIVESDSSTDLGFVNVDSLNIISSGDVNGSDIILVEVVLDIVADNGLGDVSLTNPGNGIDALALVANDVVIENDEDITRIQSLDVQTFTFTTTGNILDSEDELVVAGLATITSTAGNITLGDNNILRLGSLSVFGEDVDITESDNILVDQSVVSGSLDLTSTEEDITGLTGASIEVAGDVTLTVSEDRTIDFSESNNAFGDVTLIGSFINVSEIDGISIEAIDADSLTLDSAGDITDITGANVNVLNDATLIAAGDIVIADLESDQFNAGNLAITAVNANVVESSATQLAGLDMSGSLVLTSSGNITDVQNAVLNVAGLVTLNAGEGNSDITLNNTENRFGSVDLTGNLVLLNEAENSLIEQVTADTLTVTTTDLPVSQGATPALDGNANLS